MLQFLQDQMRDVQDKAAADDMSDDGGEAAALDMDAAAQDPQYDGMELRRSKRMLTASNQGLSGFALQQNLCDIRKNTGVVCVPGARVPVQGCFCAKGCAGHTGMCVNQVPSITTPENVLLSQGVPGYGKGIIAARDIDIGEIITTFEGIIVSSSKHNDAYETFDNIHIVQQRKTDNTEQKFEYSAKTGSDAMKGSKAWVIPPEDLPLLRECITLHALQETELNKLVNMRKTWHKGLGQFTQHTCCEKHVNAYFFPMCIMREASRRRRGGKGRHDDDEEIMHLQALAIRAQKQIKKGEEIMVHYVGAGKKGDLCFDCRCCKCLQTEGCGA